MTNPISLERLEAGLWAFIAVNGDVQIGWCRKTSQGWFVEDSDQCQQLAGPFKTRALAEEAGRKVLADQAGAWNPGW